MMKICFIIGYIIIALIFYVVLVYDDLGIDSSHKAYNKGGADGSENIGVAVFWPIALAILVCVLPFYGCYKLAFKLKEKLNPREINPIDLNKKSDSCCN